MRSIIGPIEGDTRSLDYSSCDSYGVLFECCDFLASGRAQDLESRVPDMGCSQNLGPLLALNYITAPDKLRTTKM